MSIDTPINTTDVGQAIADIIVDNAVTDRGYGTIKTDGDIIEAIYGELKSRGYEV